MSLGIPRCDYCGNLLEDDERYICKAFPDGNGIPLEILILPDDYVEKCNNGYGFIEDKSKLMLR